jgi:hypothetical protein
MLSCYSENIIEKEITQALFLEILTNIRELLRPYGEYV